MSVFVNSYYNIESLYISEKEKSTFDYLRKSVDYYITALVQEKPKIKTARNLYEGKRDPQEFRYLEETFGIETPIAVKMTPIIKTRIDVLVGIFLEDDIRNTLTIKDEGSIVHMENEKLKLNGDILIKKLEQRLKDKISANNQPPQQPNQPQQPEQPKSLIESDGEIFLKNVQKLIKSKDFISAFEVAGQSLISFFKNNNTIALKQKLRDFFTDLLITGEGYYRTHIPHVGADPKLEICKPENIFFTKNTNHQFLSCGSEPNVYAVVHRFYLTREEVLRRWGHMLNEETKTNIFGKYPEGHKNLSSPRHLDYIYRDDTADNYLHNQFTNSNLDTIECYHVQWLANNEVELSPEDKENLQRVEDITHTKEQNHDYGKNMGTGKPGKVAYRLDRYEGIRIGEDDYVEMGKSKYQPRSEGNPYSTVLDYNGCALNDRNGSPFSLPLALKGLQDSYDVITFFRDNLIANAGVDGSRINLAAIPKVLGQDYMERVLKFMALRKQGVELYDPTEDGAQLFNHYGDFSGSLNGNMIQQLEVALESIEKQADIVSGVNRFMYQASEVRDANSNVKLGQKQTSLITKNIFQTMDEVIKFTLTDLLNLGKITYRKGKRGSYLNGYNSVIFNAMPENFCFTDYDIHIVSRSQELMKMEKIAALLPELVGAGVLDPDILMSVTVADSPSAVLKMVKENIKEKKEENNQVQQLTGQLEQISSEMEKLQQTVEQYEIEIANLNKKHFDIEKSKVDIQAQKIKSDVKLKERELEMKEKESEAEIMKDKAIIELERQELYSNTSTGNEREVKNDI